MTGAGSIIIGGGGTVTGYEQLTSPNTAGVLVTPANGREQFAVDGTTDDAGGQHYFAGSTPTFDFTARGTAAIGKFRVQQTPAFPTRRVTKFRAQVSLDGASWLTVYTYDLGDFLDTGELIVPAPVEARYFRFIVDELLDPGGTWFLVEATLWHVNTVGAGNQLELVAGAEGRHLRIVGGLPAWDAPEPTIADLAATAGIAVNDAGATLVATKAEHDLTVAKVNAILAALEAAGITASS